MRKLLMLLLLNPVIVAAVANAADVVGEVHGLALRTTRAAGIPPGGQGYVLTIVDLAMFDAANAVEARFQPYLTQPPPPAGADPAAAALGAGCAALVALVPKQQSEAGKSCDDLAARLLAGPALAASRKYGEASGAALVAARRDDGSGAPNFYRPYTTAGKYVPTTLPIGVVDATMRPFSMTSPSQFRAAPPPALNSEVWSKDYNEVKALGGRTSPSRSPQQTATAVFWASGGAQQYLDSVPDLLPRIKPGVSEQARFLALVSMALSDASIAHFDSKYAYNFWRPITAIRNGDLDGNDATERDAGWVPLINTPMHPEYPCAHCNVGAAFAAVLAAYLGESELAVPLVLKSAAVPGAAASTRSWQRIYQFPDEVANARVWSGLHYRNSTAAGIAMGRSVGQWVATTQLQPLTATR